VNPAWISSFTSTARILTRYRHKITIVPNGIDLERFYCTGIRRELIVLFISVLDKYHEFKGLLYLFDAMRTVAAKYPCAKLLIIGDGDARGYYESLAVDYGVEKFVEFTGHIRQEDLKEYYSRAAVFVLPSTDTEGFGNVLLEAMACGTPVVTTEVAGMAREIEDAGAGFVVESRDSAALAAAIVALCGDEKLRERMGRNGADLVRANYSWRGVAEQVAAVYEALLRGARP
jgi:glycosyltransferase involved in cell wall biosynthesis